MELKDLELKLNELKTSLETTLTQKAKDEITLQLKAVTDELKALKDAAPKADPKVAELENTIKELKAAADLNQPVIDAFVKSPDRVIEKENKSWEFQVKKTVEENTDAIMKFSRKETKTLSMEIKAVADVSTANVTGGTVWGAIYRPGIIMNPNQIGHIRNFIPTGSAGPGTDYYFMKENGAGEGAPAFTSEKKVTAATTLATGLKPQFDLDLVESSVKFENLAGWMLISRKAMNNIPGFMSFLTRRVPEKLLDVEDYNMLYGDGNTPNLKGILVSGNFTASTSTATVLAEKIIDDLSLLEDTYKRMANGILLRPAAYYSFFKNKAGVSGEYDLPQNVVFINGVLYISGIPAFKSTALAATDYIVGDFDNGAELLIQESIRLEFFDQDGTNVRTNQTTLRIEETVAMPVFGSDYFIKGVVPDES